MMVREAVKNDLNELLQLYLFLHEDASPEQSEHLRETWNQIITDKNHHLVVKIVDNRIVSSCVCVIIPNLTRNIRPYAFIENVVTHGEYRGKGYATECLNYAREIAVRRTSIFFLCCGKEEKILQFYQNAGYNSTDKTAFIQWIDV